MYNKPWLCAASRAVLSDLQKLQLSQSSKKISAELEHKLREFNTFISQGTKIDFGCEQVTRITAILVRPTNGPHKPTENTVLCGQDMINF